MFCIDLVGCNDCFVVDKIGRRLLVFQMFSHRQKQISDGCDLLRQWLYASINMLLFQFRGYPGDSFQSVYLLGVPIKVTKDKRVREFIESFTNSLHFSNAGQQELSFKFDGITPSGQQSKNCVVFRFQCFVLQTEELVNIYNWQDCVRIALRQLSIFQTNTDINVHDGQWNIFLRNWFDKTKIIQEQFIVEHYTTSQIEVKNTTCFPIYAMKNTELSLTVFYNSSEIGTSE